MKKIHITRSEKVYLQLQVDALNAFNHPLFFYNPNTGRTQTNGFNTASITNPAVPAFTIQSSFGMVWQPNSALVSLRLFF